MMSKTWVRVLLLVGLVFALPMCGDDESAAPAAIAVAISGAHSVDIGQTLTLSATTRNAADSAYSWQSSSEEVATVDDAGVVTGVTAGEASITATGASSGASAAHAVVVLPAAADSPVVQVTGNPYLLIGATVTLSATTVGGVDASYSWASSDVVLATVDANGVVTGNAVGDVTITATGADTGLSGSMLVAVAQESPNYDKWLSSGHADATAEAFNHWNEDDPAEIPTSCAKCHSAPGFIDFIGGDGSAAEVVDQPAPVGTVIHCGACHNDAADQLDTVTFPSGVTIDNLGPEARCMTCHQGRASTDSVDDSITAAGVANDDEVSSMLSFQNIHYYAAGATINAGRVRGGYQYTGQLYDWRFRHVPGKDNCIGCHDPHSLEIRFDDCKQCHQDLESLADLKDIRMMASLNQDYDGDSDLTEGIFYEIEGLRTLLLAAIETYTVEETLGAICYDPDAYPYWFQDTDMSGDCSMAEAVFANAWPSWTARLLRATYNYQVSLKDPGGFAHNAKYLIQLLYDSIADLNTVLAGPVDLGNAVRNDTGHFNGAGEAARHWDEDEAVSANCSRCHGASEGFRFYLQFGVGIEVPEQDNGIDCATCHDNFGTTYDTVPVDSVTFPSGITISDPGNVSNICMTCHQGRESKKTIDDSIAQNNFRFKNVHYLPAGAVKKGTLAKVGYEYDNKTYAGEWVFHGQCINCHDPKATNHSFLPEDNVLCTNGCHSPTLIANIRTTHTLDYDGDTNATEPLGDEIQGMAAAVLAQMQTIAAICYSSTTYPYFFKDTNTNDVCDGTEASFSNQFGPWTPALMKSAHNYQISQKDPGAWAHNFDYTAQLLYDSVEDLGGNPPGLGLIRP